MLTVPQAAKRVARDPETVRRWIRSGKLRARKIGIQHFIEEADLDAFGPEAEMLPLPKEWRRMSNGQPQLNWVEAIRRSREGR